MARSPFEIYENPVPKEVSDLPPRLGYVTWVGTNSTDRDVCMREAFSTLLGSPTAGAELGTTLKNYELMLQVFRIDDTETTLVDFAIVFERCLEASRVGIGPRMLDGWVAATDNAPIDGHRTSFGFIMFHKPNYTLAEYSELLKSRKGNEGLREAVVQAAPAVRDLVVRISEHGKCWPGPLLDPHGVGIYAVRDVDPEKVEYAVVTDWSTCMLGKVPPSRIIPSLLENYKKFLDDLENRGRGIEREQNLFFEAMKKLV